MVAQPTPPLVEGSHSRRQDFVRVDLLYVDERWQRDYKESWAKWIADNWSDDECGLLEVAHIGDRYAVIDGQHRLGGATIVGIGELPCWIYEGLVAEQMAHLFEAKNGNRRPVDAVSMFKNRVFQGKPDSVEAKRIVEGLGLVIPTHKTPQRDGQILAVGALMYVYHTYGAIMLRQTLRVLMGAWDLDSAAYQAVPLKGTALFLSRYRDQFDERHLIDRLKSHSPAQIKRNASNLAEITTANVDTAWAQTVLAVYNKALTTRRLSEWVGRVRVAKPRSDGTTDHTGIRRAVS